MKHRAYLLAALFTGLIVFSSCTQNEESGRLTLGLELNQESTLKAATSDKTLSHALLTIMGEDGSLIYDKEPIDLLRFGNDFVTRSLELPVGVFLLTEFMLADSTGTILWATPKEGSELARLVNNPLPQDFKIQADQSTSVNIQVIRIGTHPPEDFGYVQFSIDFVKRFCLKVQFSMRCPDYESDSILGPDGTVIPWYQSRIQIRAGKRIILDKPMAAGLNRYELPVMSEIYYVTAIGCGGDIIFNEKFYLDELSTFRCNPDYPPLLIPGNQDPNIIITPEGLYKPNIRQGIFGQITGPLDNFMDSVIYETQALVKDICLFPYHVLDSLYTFAPIDCYISYDMIHWEPEAVVKSNSEGFFQVPLDPGEYLYLVKTDMGYYMDAFISSHQPGYVLVSPEEVSELSIHLVDCSMWQ